MMISMVSVPAFAEGTGEQGIVEEQQQFSIPEKTVDKAVRTIMLYDCGANLETQGGLATYNLLQVLRAKFSANGSVRFIVMTGGSEVWQTESDYLYDPVTGTSPEKINTEYNQIWEAMGADAPENPGKLVLVDGDGVLGDGENAKRAQIDPEDMSGDGEDSYFDRTKADNYEWMTNPEVLKAFINYCAEKYPAENYDLILWDHGGGPMGGFGSDENDYGGGFSSMTFSQIVDALYDNTVVRGGGKFDFIDFDACLMNGLEFDLALAGCAKYYIASPELEPGYGQDFEGWMNALGEDPAMDTFRLGKKIVDDFVAFYDKEEGDGSSQEGTLAVINLEALMNSKLLEDLSYLCDNLDFDTGPGSLYYDELRSVSASLNYGDMSYIDLGNLVSQLGYVYKEANWNNVEDNVVIDTNGYTEAALSILSVLNDPSIIYAGGTKGIKTEKQYYRDADGTMQYGQQGTSGVYLFFPTPKNASSTISYYKMMGEIIGKMEQDAPERTFLDAYRQTMLKYTLIYYTGQAVSEMFDQGKEKQDIDVDSVIEHWKEGAETEEDLRISTWSLAIKPLLDLLGGEEAMTKWLDYNIYQMTREAILRKNITVTSQKEGAGSNYTVEITDSRKQVVDNVVVNLIAELPAYEAFLDLPENREDKDFWMREFSGQKIGSINGELVCDVDPETDGYVALVEWLHEEKSTWNLPAMEEKWYAIQDAEGTLHVAAAEVEDDGVYVLTGSPVQGDHIDGKRFPYEL